MTKSLKDHNRYTAAAAATILIRNECLPDRATQHKTKRKLMYGKKICTEVLCQC